MQPGSGPPASRPTHDPVVTIARSPEFILGLEQLGSTTLVHFRFLVPVNPGVWKRGLRAWHTLVSLHGGPFHCLETPDDPQHARFLGIMGYRVVGTGTNQDDIPVRLWRYDAPVQEP